MRNPNIETNVVLKDIEVDADVAAAFWKLVSADCRGGVEEQRSGVAQAIEQLMREHINTHLKKVERASRNAGQAAPAGSVAAALTNLADVFPEFDAMLREDMGLNRWPLNRDARPQELSKAVGQAIARGLELAKKDAQDLEELRARDAALQKAKRTCCATKGDHKA